MSEGYTPGNCTAYVSSLCPWIPLDLGNADTWLDNAKAAGLVTTDTPAVGAVACWAAGSGGAGADGHVAKVIGLSGGLVVVTEMNWTDVLGQIDTRSVNPSNIAGYILPPAPAPQGVTMYDTTRDQWVSAWVGADSKVYYRIAKTLEELLSNPPQPLEEPTGGAPGTKLIISQGVDTAGNYLFSLHGSDDTVWYVASPDGGQTWQVANDPAATLLPPATTATVAAAIAAAIAALPVPITQAQLDSWESAALAGLPTDVQAAVQKAIASLPASTSGASATHVHVLTVDGVAAPTAPPSEPAA
jgi:surface antigen